LNRQGKLARKRALLFRKKNSPDRLIRIAKSAGGLVVTNPQLTQESHTSARGV
jgi:predicted RNA-binding protein YlxR (DUF448 family)